MKLQQIVPVILISAATSVGSMWAYNKFAGNNLTPYTNAEAGSKIPANYAGLFDGVNGSPTDFQQAAASSIPATVHIKTKATRTASNNLPRRSPLFDLFGFDWDEDMSPRTLPQMASGSGAIISDDGYIVTNNHVVDGADEITVTMSDKKSYKAKLVGADPSSDLAVIKIEAKDLPFLLYGNSDEVQVGQWVLAIGYPLNLETTVTAGIVSAKGRTLEINKRQSRTPIESFIQTDAAVNPGNSGGPLVNTAGQLIGINSAIASPTGSYAGYSFTIPVNIVKKIVADLMKFGTVQRAYLGINYAPDNLSDEIKKEQGIKEGEGVFVLDVTKDGAAAAGGIKKGDFITRINNVPVKSGAEMVGQIATYRPGDKVKIGYRRDGKDFISEVVLRNSSGTTEVVKSSVLDKLGADLATIDGKLAKELGVKGGVIVRGIDDKGAFSKTRMEEGFVILKVNGKDVSTVEQFRAELEKAGSSVTLDGMYPGYEGVFRYPMRLTE
ncbi:trypsin-like peptidase domain-containing protein [Flavihumibacter rivuli]|uniref:trypsin-like peptidase domain-containing protein n=1 Tax=Flavihumibacter rivuli TaxID=2838156 RepID=UPI001BDE7BF5|nr:trypsin-like peptidase domain-containing protein [Flavihumibacter rivuli]ULQ56676.1 trypsin-like peptidase domain-containing protein [Flavihumibacter rivuli]